MEFTLAGAYYRPDNIRAFLRDLTEPVNVHLVPDPLNRVDRNAIKVVYNDMHLGFVPAIATNKFKQFSKATLIPSDDEFYKEQPTIKINSSDIVFYEMIHDS